jgi:lipopolysaccharide exporter
LAIYGVSSVAMANQGPLLIALGHARVVAVLLGLGLVMLVPGFIWASMHYGVLGGAWAVSITNVLLFLISLVVTLRLVGISFLDSVRQFWRSLIGALTMTIALRYVLSELQAVDLSSIVVLLTGVILGAIVYMSTVFILWFVASSRGGPERLLITFLGLGNNK